MVTLEKYMRGYFEAITSRRYWIKLGPLGGLLLLWLFKPLSDDIPNFKWWIIGTTVAWLFVVVFWWGFDFLNDQLEQRDADYLKTSPRAREDRAFHILSGLLRDGKNTLTGWTPEQIEGWDRDVRLALAAWCNESAMSVYILNSRPYPTERLNDPRKALDQLHMIVNVHLSLFIK